VLILTTNEATAHQVGFSDRILDMFIPPKTVEPRREIRESLTNLGVFKGNGRETLRGYVTVPIRGTDDVVIGIRDYKIDRHAQGASIVMLGIEQLQGNGLAAEDAENTEGMIKLATHTVSGTALAAGNLLSGTALAAGNLLSGTALAAGNLLSGTALAAGNLLSGTALAAGNLLSGTALAAGNTLPLPHNEPNASGLSLTEPTTSASPSAEPNPRPLSINDDVIVLDVDDQRYRIRGREKTRRPRLCESPCKSLVTRSCSLRSYRTEAVLNLFFDASSRR
jgi:hypothetical protein